MKELIGSWIRDKVSRMIARMKKAGRINDEVEERGKKENVLEIGSVIGNKDKGSEETVKGTKIGDKEKEEKEYKETCEKKEEELVKKMKKLIEEWEEEKMKKKRSVDEEMKKRGEEEGKKDRMQKEKKEM
jgi:hypothetical protein